MSCRDGMLTEAPDPVESDPPLLKSNSEVRSFSTSRFKYSGIRTFYRRHPKTDELPKDPAPLPLLVFVHGLGGSVAQFYPLLMSLTNMASCFAIDMPGCGRSELDPLDWDAYTTDALVELWETAIEEYRDKKAGQGVVLIGHSMGSSIAALLASRQRKHTTRLAEHVMALVATCPSPEPPTESQVRLIRAILWIPTPIFDLWRAWDRRGGLESASISRFVGPDADVKAKRMQLRFNNQSRSPTFRRMAWGSLPVYEKGVPKGGMPGRETWSSLDIPVCLIGGASDTTTPPSGVDKIAMWLKESSGAHHAAVGMTGEVHTIVDSAGPVDTSPPTPDDNGPATATGRPSSSKTSIKDITAADFAAEHDPEHHLATETAGSTVLRAGSEDPTTPQEPPHPPPPPQPAHPPQAVEAVILPPPAAHALLYAPSTARIVAGLVSDFLATRVTGRLSLGWQLQWLSREGKWDVKNLAKWRRVRAVGDVVGPGIFRAMKTLREADEEHSPAVFAARWAPPRPGEERSGDPTRGDGGGGNSSEPAPAPYIADVIDISHDVPVYDPRGLERAGIRYHKFPTVSKIPPSDEEVSGFVALVDSVRRDRQGAKDCVIGLHCHYGFNRTGYFIVCYLVERLNYSVREAIEAFEKARPNGIRHQHFLDNLELRYCSGIKKEVEREA